MARAIRKKTEAPPEPLALSRERVCKEALALVDEEGLAALSMRRLADRDNAVSLAAAVEQVKGLPRCLNEAR